MYTYHLLFEAMHLLLLYYNMLVGMAHKLLSINFFQNLNFNIWKGVSTETKKKTLIRHCICILTIKAKFYIAKSEVWYSQSCLALSPGSRGWRKTKKTLHTHIYTLHPHTYGIIVSGYCVSEKELWIISMLYFSEI